MIKKKTCLLLIVAWGLFSPLEAIQAATKRIYIAKNISFKSEKEKEYKIHEFVLPKTETFREARIFVDIINGGDFDDNEMRTIQFKLSTYSSDKSIPTFSKIFNPMMSGVTIPISPKYQKVVITGIDLPHKNFKISINSIYRDNTFFNATLSENTVKQFDERINDFYDLDIIYDKLYGEKDSQDEKEEFYIPMFFDSIFEMEDYFSPDCMIIIKDDDGEVKFNRQDFIMFLGQTNFVIGSRMENIEQPKIEIENEESIITEKKKIISPYPSGKGKDFKSKMKVKILKDRIVVTEWIQDYITPVNSK